MRDAAKARSLAWEAAAARLREDTIELTDARELQEAIGLLIREFLARSCEASAIATHEEPRSFQKNGSPK